MAETLEGHASSVPAQGEVDTTRPFRSVKEAVAVFGERLLTGDASSSHKVTASSKVDTPPMPILSFPNLVPKPAEVEEIKQELIHMKERESQTAKTIANLRSQVQDRISKLEAAESAQPVDQWQEYRTTNLEERFEYLPSLRQVLSIVRTDDQDQFGRRRIKLQKKKPIVPLVGDMFSRKKGANVDLSSSFYSRSSINSFT
ncbi:WEB family protein At3g51220-like [Zingiber officinale]|uniref:WEB family protein At3g51220-like n=1 Tax=Zingiber officinale TaxID=94328 RepID=UPI001C4D4A7B|nr:WEB family protein At3g51220-like [Zingiber officinale]